MILLKTRMVFVLLFALTPLAHAELADPTRPLAYVEAVQMHCSKGNILLQSINYAQTKQVALINGNFYTIGDQVDLYKIIAITPDSVTLQRDNKTRVLTL